MAADADKALTLVRDYARLQDIIQGARKRIGDALEGCPGINGFRKEEEPLDLGDDGPPSSAPTERAMNDAVHLSQWYSADEDEYGRREYPDPSEAECPHCWAAHQVVQERKRARKALGAVKGSMRKLGRKVAA